MERTVTIPLQEYDELRKIEKAIMNDKVYLTFDIYHGNKFVTSDTKDEWINYFLREVNSLKSYNRSLENDIKKYQELLIKHKINL